MSPLRILPRPVRLGDRILTDLKTRGPAASIMELYNRGHGADYASTYRAVMRLARDRRVIVAPPAKAPGRWYVVREVRVNEQ